MFGKPTHAAAPMTDRRRTDQASHAHKRAGESEVFARLHQRLDDNDKIMTELITSKTELVELQKGTTVALNALAASQTALVAEISKLAGLREFADDVSGMMGLMARFNNGIGILWKPMLFIAVLGGTLWLWIVGGKPPS
jgi:hypothetical protein